MPGQRDKVIAACLTGAVVVVVGYASGIGLRTNAAAAPAPVQQPPAVAAPPVAGLPASPPPAGAVPTQPPPAALPLPQYPQPTMPSFPAPQPQEPPMEHPPGHGDPDPSEPPEEPPAGEKCEDGAVRTLLGMLLPPTEGLLDGLLGYCDQPEEPHQGHGG